MCESSEWYTYQVVDSKASSDVGVVFPCCLLKSASENSWYLLEYGYDYGGERFTSAFQLKLEWARRNSELEGCDFSQRSGC